MVRGGDAQGVWVGSSAWHQGQIVRLHQKRIARTCTLFFFITLLGDLSALRGRTPQEIELSHARLGVRSVENHLECIKQILCGRAYRDFLVVPPLGVRNICTFLPFFCLRNQPRGKGIKPGSIKSYSFVGKRVASVFTNSV